MSRRELVDELNEQLQKLASHNLKAENNKFVKRLQDCILKAELLDTDGLMVLATCANFMLEQLDKVSNEQPFTGCTILSQFAKELNNEK